MSPVRRSGTSGTALYSRGSGRDSYFAQNIRSPHNFTSLQYFVKKIGFDFWYSRPLFIIQESGSLVSKLFDTDQDFAKITYCNFNTFNLDSSINLKWMRFIRIQIQMPTLPNRFIIGTVFFIYIYSSWDVGPYQTLIYRSGKYSVSYIKELHGCQCVKRGKVSSRTTDHEWLFFDHYHNIFSFLLIYSLTLNFESLNTSIVRSEPWKSVRQLPTK